MTDPLGFRHSLGENWRNLVFVAQHCAFIAAVATLWYWLGKLLELMPGIGLEKSLVEFIHEAAGVTLFVFVLSNLVRDIAIKILRDSRVVKKEWNSPEGDTSE